MKTIVVGAGLGGLTSAIALRQAEFDVTVVERACELTPAGAGISLWPNAVKALESLGLGSDLRRIAAPRVEPFCTVRTGGGSAGR